MRYVRNATIALDRFLNALLLAGEPTDTISENSARNRHKWWGCVLCKWLHWTVEREHCDKALLPHETPLRAGLLALVQLLALALIIAYAPFIIALLCTGGVILWHRGSKQP